MPFTQEEFFAVFAAWNTAVWPLQVVAYLLGLAAFALAFRGTRRSTGALLIILALMWLVNGAGYRWAFFTEVNPAAWLFGTAFLLQALLLAAAPLIAPGFRIAPAKDVRTVMGFALIAYALVVYPLLGWAIGDAYPAVPVFGIAPCPTTIFTIGLLLLGSWRTARWLLVIPGLWGLVGGSAAVLLGVPQDYGLILATLLALAVALGRGVRAGLGRHEVGAG